MYVDEAGFSREAERQYGLAPIGQKVHGTRASNSRPRTSLLAANINNSLQATMLFDGTCDTNVFNTWLKTFLCPILQKRMVVIMDNATFHKSKETVQLIRRTGAKLLFLPPYSPDFNNIEHDFAVLKRKRSYHPEISLYDLVKMYP